MAVKKYENGAYVKCTKEINSRVSHCIDVDTHEPFGRTSGEYDLVLFFSPTESVHNPYEAETAIVNGFCFDEIEPDGRRFLTCHNEKDNAEYLYEENRKENRNVQKYF